MKKFDKHVIALPLFLMGFVVRIIIKHYAKKKKRDIIFLPEMN